MEPYALNARWFFLVFFALFHFAVAALIARTRLPFVDGPVRAWATLLFVLNGLVTIGAAAREMAPEESWPIPLIQFADDPTGLAILLLGAHLLRGNRPMGRRLSWLFLPLGLWMAMVVLRTASLTAEVPFPYVDLDLADTLLLMGGSLLVPTLLFAGYILVTIATAVRLVRATDQRERIFMVLLMAAFVPRVIEFSMVYGFSDPVMYPEYDLAVAASYTLEALLARAMGPVALAVLVWSSVAEHRRSADLTLPAYLVLMGIAGVALGIGTQLVDGQPGYFAGVLSLVVIRPLLAGAAFSRTGTVDALLVTSALFAAFVALHALVNLLFGLGFFQLDGAILLTVALVLSLVPVAWAFALRLRLAVEGVVRPKALLQQAPSDAGMGLGPREVAAPEEGPDNATRIIKCLTTLPGAAPHDRGVTAQQIAEATGIDPKNLAAAIRRLEQQYADHLADGGRLVESEIIGVRGRKVYRRGPSWDALIGAGDE